jgi:hypothetical protein
VHKSRDKSCHEKHIKMKIFKEGDLVLLYDNKFLQHPGNFGMHWLGPYEVKNVTYGESVQLKELGGIKLKGMINDNRMKNVQEQST